MFIKLVDVGSCSHFLLAMTGSSKNESCVWSSSSSAVSVSVFRPQSIVKNMETAWLGRLAYLVSGGVTCPEQQRLIEEALSSLPASVPATQRARLSVLCSRPPNTDAEFAAAVRDALQGTPLQPAVLKRVAHKLTARRPALRVAALSSSRSGQVGTVEAPAGWCKHQYVSNTRVCGNSSLTMFELW